MIGRFECYAELTARLDIALLDLLAELSVPLLDLVMEILLKGVEQFFQLVIGHGLILPRSSPEVAQRNTTWSPRTAEQKLHRRRQSAAGEVAFPTKRLVQVVDGAEGHMRTIAPVTPLLSGAALGGDAELPLV